ncbi:RNI-like superfamily protein [Forsythia ovata]|uniref:RNI-like superfamily protein n=1 Tax=Forsythia ovata TaxID=205694 RepID=A0ABD1WCV8_9LAMI
MASQNKPSYILKMLNDKIENISTSCNINADTIENEIVYSFGELRSELRKDLEKTMSLIPRFKKSEDLLMEKFHSLEMQLDEVHLICKEFDQLTMLPSMINGMRMMLQETNEKIFDDLRKEEKAPILLRQQQTHSDVQMPKIMSDNWLNLQIEENILDSPMMSNFQMSFDILSIHLRLCLLTFAVFPEEQLIKRKPLIYWWIGEGFITKSGEETFMELIGEGLIQPSHKSLKNPVIYGCTVHPWIHRMLISMARQANFFDLGTTGKATNGYQKSLRFVLDEKLSTNDYHPKGELSAIINMRDKYPSFSKNFFSMNGRIKVLQLGRWQNSHQHYIEIKEAGKLLDKLKMQKQLKYLSLRGISRITTLPSSIVGCQNLEILDLRACYNLETLPFDIGTFKKLKHFDVSECYLLENLPKGLENLSSLEVLKVFVVNPWRKNSCRLASLQNLEKLIKLSINIGIALPARPLLELPPLKPFNLRILIIIWQMRSTSIDKTNKEEERRRLYIFEDVSFPKLEKLDLRCFPDTMLPSWISPENMGNLKRLYIRGGMLETLLPVSEKFNPWNVEILRLNYLKNFRFQESFDVQKEFPHLSYLERINCNRIADGKYDANIEWRLDDGWEMLKSKLGSEGSDGFTSLT